MRVKQGNFVTNPLNFPRDNSPVALKLPEKLPFEQWQTLLGHLGMITRVCLWWLGDALAYGEREYGMRYKAALASTGLGHQTLRNAVWVSRRIDPSRRRDKLSWAHHAEVAALEPDQQDALLREAEVEMMSREELRRAVRQLARRTEMRAKLHNTCNPDGCGRRIGPFRCCTVICGDAEALLADLPRDSVAGVVSEPPYGLDSEDWDDSVPYHLLGQFLHIATGPIIWFGSAPTLVQACATFDPRPDRVLIWSPQFTLAHAVGDGIAFRYHCIFCWRLPKQHDGPAWDVLDTPTERGNWWLHPCTKPVLLMIELIASTVRSRVEKGDAFKRDFVPPA